MKLWMFYIGGDCGNSNIELHDVRFSIGKTPEDCFDDLRRQWWGEPRSLHLDCWGSVEQADGFDVTLETAAELVAERLFFINLGGYDPLRFEELHKNVLLVGPDAKSVIARALAGIERWSEPHRDKVFEVEKTVDITALTKKYGRHLILTKAAVEKPFSFVCKYRPLR